MSKGKNIKDVEDISDIKELIKIFRVGIADIVTFSLIKRKVISCIKTQLAFKLQQLRQFRLVCLPWRSTGKKIDCIVLYETNKNLLRIYTCFMEINSFVHFFPRKCVIVLS